MIIQAPHPKLYTVCAPVEAFDNALKRLSNLLHREMRAANGLGLAAPQVGVLKRVVAIGVNGLALTMVNPKIVDHSTETRAALEGCLSLKRGAVRVSVRRPIAVTVRWKSITGAEEQRSFNGLAATCVQHEIDHLDGRMIG